MQRFLFFVLIIILPIFGFSETIKIGVFQGYKLKKAKISVKKGKYDLFIDGILISEISLSQSAVVSSSSSGFIVTLSGKEFKGKKIILSSKVLNSEFYVSTSVKNRLFQDNLIAKVRSGYLVLINEINLDKYISGVVAAEVGNNRPYEYYKVQAIISRTYALSNKTKHETEGFHLCDQTHCQVYHGKPQNNKIILAAHETSDYVLTDHNIELITTVFHSNCGGQTINSDNVWSKPLPYLMGVKDTFCLVMPNSHWEKSIPLVDWVEYLEEKDLITQGDTTSIEDIVGHFPRAKSEFYSGNNRLRNVEIRKDWKLRSAWFNILEDGEQVTFYGRGFGHGVGLCQEGAIRMAELGHSYSDIIHFYYNDVHLIDLNYLNFFKD